MAMGRDDATGELAHADVANLVVQAWDQEISERDAERLIRHLKACPACAAGAHRLREFLAALEDSVGNTSTTDLADRGSTDLKS